MVFDLVDEKTIQTYWNENPVGEMLLPGQQAFSRDAAAFFAAYDAYRYKKEPHILHRLDAMDLRDKSVLEIGLGQGADSEQLIRRGAIWTGLDLTEESVHRVRTRLAMRELPYQAVVRGSATATSFPDNSFDVIYSFGVLHHIPDIRAVSRELHRIVRPGGCIVLMLYARNSLNYQISIRVVRRLALMLALAWPLALPPKLERHRENARAIGLFNYLRMRHFIHVNTDGPDNPYSKIYDLPSAREDFPEFEIIGTEKAFLHAPPLPTRYLPARTFLAKRLGWHLWLTLKPRKTSAPDPGADS